MKKLFTMILAVIFVASMLYGCGAKSESTTVGNGAAMDKMEMEAPGEAGEGYSGLTSSSGSTATSQTPMNQKLVRKIWLNAETDDLDALLTQVDQQISALSGYAEKREIYHGSPSATRRYRRATLTVRIPVAQLDQFVSHVTELSNITSSNETADDITLTYIATQSRVSALQTEHDRLLELLAKAENMSDLLKIEQRLTEVRADLEEVASKLKLYDNMVDYGTVYLELSEVKEYTDVTEPETLWQRIGKGFMQSLKDLGNFFTELFVFIMVGLPYFVILAVVIAVVILLIKRRRKKAKQPIQTDLNKQ